MTCVAHPGGMRTFLVAMLLVPALFAGAAADHPEDMIHFVNPYTVDIPTPDAAGHGELWLTNGRHEDVLTVVVSVAAPAGWTIRLNATTFVLAPGDSVMTGISVTPPPGAEPGTIASLAFEYDSDGGGSGSSVTYARIGEPRPPIHQSFTIQGTAGFSRFDIGHRGCQVNTPATLVGLGAACDVVRAREVPVSCAVTEARGFLDGVGVTFTSWDGRKGEMTRGDARGVATSVPSWSAYIQVEVTGLAAGADVTCTYFPPPRYPSVH